MTKWRLEITGEGEEITSITLREKKTYQATDPDTGETVEIEGKNHAQSIGKGDWETQEDLKIAGSKMLRASLKNVLKDVGKDWQKEPKMKMVETH
jgi:hypothetical protein